MYWVLRCLQGIPFVRTGLEIFVDDEFKSGGRPSSPGCLPSSAAAGPSGPAWAHLGSFEQTRKENVQQAGTWAGAPIPFLYDTV